MEPALVVGERLIGRAIDQRGLAHGQLYRVAELRFVETFGSAP